jgi:predicted Zn-dependent protease
MIETLGARIKQARGDPAQATAILDAARKQYPNSRSVLYAQVLSQQENGHNEEALANLAEPMRLYPNDASLRALQAKCYAALGKRLLQHQAQAEVYVLQGSLPQAIEQLQLARGAGDGDFYQLSQVDARLKELRSQYSREQMDAKR